MWGKTQQILRQTIVGPTWATIKPADVLRTPCINERGVHIYDASRWQAAFRKDNQLFLGEDVPYARRQVGIETWLPEELERYVDYMHACGLNELKAGVSFGRTAVPRKYQKAYGSIPQSPHSSTYVPKTYQKDCGSTNACGEYEKQVEQPLFVALSKAARERGMKMGIHFNAWSGIYGWSGEDRRKTEQRFQELARLYAEHTDLIYAHWCDPGDFKGYVLCQEAQASMLKEFQKINPKIAEARIWMWLNPTFWDGDPRMKSFLDETFSTREIGIGLSDAAEDIRKLGQEYPELAKRVRQSGRKVGIIRWYFADNEDWLGSNLYRMQMDGFFKKPWVDFACLDFITVDRFWHALPADINLYIAGQKMWDRNRPSKDIALDYLQALYGSNNAEKMWTVYETLSRYIDRCPTPDDIQPFVEALKLLDTVYIPSFYIPSIATPNTPQGYIVDLDRELKGIIVAVYLKKEQAAKSGRIINERTSK